MKLQLNEDICNSLKRSPWFPGLNCDWKEEHLVTSHVHFKLKKYIMDLSCRLTQTNELVSGQLTLRPKVEV